MNSLPAPKTNVIVATATSCKRTGLMCYHRRAASFSRSQDKSYASPIPLRQRGHGLQRRIQRMMELLCSTYVPRQGHASMLVSGEWRLRDDGVRRPIVRARVGGMAVQYPELSDR
jgi:hypothetical protein